MSATPIVTVLVDGRPIETDEHLAKFAAFWGLESEIVPLANLACDGLTGRQKRSRVLAMRAEIYALVCAEKLWSELESSALGVILYGLNAEKVPPDSVGRIFSEPVVIELIPPGTRTLEVCKGLGLAAFPESGLRCRIELGTTNVIKSSGKAHPSAVPLLTIDGLPCALEVTHHEIRYILISGRDLVDLDAQVSTKEASLRIWYPAILSVSLAIHSLAGDWCWSSPVVPANIIIDDPFLRERYGFMCYEPMLDALKRSGGALTVAFIPYYHRRSSPRTIDLVREHSERFSIAVHGCDHTRMEFGNANYEWVSGAAATALLRMSDHERRTGMPFDPVMVFPQGKFSRAAVGAAKGCSYLATVNSGAWPVDREGWHMTLRDLLGMAVTRHEAFPVFTRRYPGAPFDFAFDAFFQKPILAVEHHGYFREGYTMLESFVESISSLNPRVKWMPLGKALASTYQMRRKDRDTFIVRHLTDRLLFTNPCHQPIAIEVEKPETREIEAVRVVTGTTLAFTLQNGLLKYQLSVDARQSIEVRIAYPPVVLPEWRTSWKYRFGVLLRRAISDCRDYWQYLAAAVRPKRSKG